MAYPPSNQVGFVMPGQHSGPAVYQQPQQQPYYPPQAGPQSYPPPSHQPFPAPIQNQPAGYAPVNQASWFAANSDFATYLYGASSFHVKQKIELLEILTNWEQGNKYTVKGQAGHKMFYVGEQSDCLARQCCASYRPFSMTVKDFRGFDILRFERPLRCSLLCGALCPDSMTVSTNAGVVLGYVKENFSLFYPKFSLKNAAGQTMLRIEGPMCPLAYRCTEVVFRVTTRDGVNVGSISKQWGGLVRELFTDADCFTIAFPIDLDTSMKAVCLAALFLIDYEYFEMGADKKQGGRRIFG